MKKLTAERAQERIAHLKQWQEQRGLTLREEEYLEALEGYLPILEQKERGAGGWIKWCGGSRPIKYLDNVEMRLRSGAFMDGQAGDWSWQHTGSVADIIAYRIIPERAQ